MSADVALEQLRRRLGRLWRTKGEPSSHEISRRCDKAISHTTVLAVLKCRKLPRWGPLEVLVETLGGEVDEFLQLWILARDAADDGIEPEASSPPDAATPATAMQQDHAAAPPLPQVPIYDRIDRRQLTDMELLGEGGSGRVFQVRGPTTTGPASWFAFKEIRADTSSQLQESVAHAMTEAVTLRLAMVPIDRAELDRITVWPVAVVESDKRTVGTLMPLIPSDFYIDAKRPNQRAARVIFEFQFLCASDRWAKAAGIDRSIADDDLVRLSLVAQLSYAVALLHKHQIVYGDLSLKNVAVAMNPPRILLLDCDGAAPLQDSGRRQLHSPFFSPPEIATKAQRLQDLETDVYKLGLCILRGLSRGPGVTQLADPTRLTGKLSPDGVDLIVRALSADRRQRPTAHELSLYLLAHLANRLATVPTPHEAPFVPADMPTELPTVTQPPVRSPQVYISYRRSDPHAAYLLYEYLSRSLGEGSISIDLDNSEPGVEFPEAIDVGVSRCRILLTVIGAGWLGPQELVTESLLADPEDLVRLEVESAIRHGIRLIPVLLDSTARLKSTQLPVGLATLARRNPFVLRSNTFKDDALRLADYIKRILGDREEGGIENGEFV